MNNGYVSAENGECLISKVDQTTTFFERFIGLLGSKPLSLDKALLITPCSSIHTIGMRYPIDLIFLNNNWVVIKTVHSLKPWRFAFAYSASMVLEISANTLKALNINVGQKLYWHEN